MATYKITYILKREEYVEDVMGESEAVMIANYRNSDIPQDAKVQIELISE